MLDINHHHHTHNNAVSSAPAAAAPSSSFDHNNNGGGGGGGGGSVTNKRKRRPAGTPDPDAEVVSLSPKTLLESDRYVCEICNQGFQRDQNLQMHRRRHKVPWKLLKRETPDEVKKRVFVCPEPSCLHHDPCHALGDLVGIKKHFRRKHSNHKQWVCEKCSKGYAVQSDYKAHLKTCGTRGHSCDCGRVFSRVESFIEHQDTCSVRHVVRPEMQVLQPTAACSSRTASSTSPSSDGRFSISNNNALPPPLHGLPIMPKQADQPLVFRSSHEGHDGNTPSTSNQQQHHHQQEHMQLELQLLPSSSNAQKSSPHSKGEIYETNLKLSIGGGGGSSPCEKGDHRKNESPRSEKNVINNIASTNFGVGPSWEVARLKEFASEELKLAMAEKTYAEDARREAKRQIEMAELEFANAKRIRQQAQAEMEKAQLLKEQATKKISSAIMQITCQSCKQHFHTSSSTAPGGVGPSVVDETTSLGMSYMSSATTEGEADQ